MQPQVFLMRVIPSAGQLRRSPHGRRRRVLIALRLARTRARQANTERDVQYESNYRDF